MDGKVELLNCLELLQFSIEIWKIMLRAKDRYECYELEKPMNFLECKKLAGFSRRGKDIHSVQSKITIPKFQMEEVKVFNIGGDSSRKRLWRRVKYTEN